MTNFKILAGSENYTAQVIKLPVKIPVAGLDNLVVVNHQGNQCLVSKDSNEEELHIFFPSECVLSPSFLSISNLYRDSSLNADQTKKGFFDNNGRVKSIKFKGVISTGFIISLSSFMEFLNKSGLQVKDFPVGAEFNTVMDILVCSKYVKPEKSNSNGGTNQVKKEMVDSRFAPEHFSTSHLLKNTHKLDLEKDIAITYKLHGCSARYFRTKITAKLTLLERICKYLGIKIQDTYDYVSGSRRTIKSVGFNTLPNKNHYYKSTNKDLWTTVGEELFMGKLNKGEGVYCEIIGKTFDGSFIQGGYSYGLEAPKVYIYRITNINPEGIEIDLSYQQMKQRALQLGVEVCPEFFYGKLGEFINNYKDMLGENDSIETALNKIFYDKELEKPSILDNSVVEEGFCVRIDNYPSCDIFKIKSRAFLLHEGHQLDTQSVNLEEDVTQI